MRRYRAMLLLSVLALSVLVGCGNKEEPAANAGGPAKDLANTEGSKGAKPSAAPSMGVVEGAGSQLGSKAK